VRDKMQTTEKPIREKKMVVEVSEGLKKSQKSLPSKYFYDQRGSELFEEICKLPEYYPTDVEVDIMELNIDEIVGRLGSGIELIEFGSGSSTKTRLLLEHLNDITAYIPVDISRNFLLIEANKLQAEFPKLTICPVAADYTHPFQLPADLPSCRKVVYFPGSTIGNFVPQKARLFLKQIAKLTGKNGGLLIGVDTKKDPDVLEAAYNDKAGVTAAFNKNLLVRLNREINTNFDVDQFQHKAIYNEDEGRIEMHLVSLANQNVSVNGEFIEFRKGETIHTENSYKYSPLEFQKLVSDYFKIDKTWTDTENLFSVHYLITVNE